METFFEKIMSMMPDDWDLLSSELKLHHVMLAASDVLKVEGKWVLVNGDLTLLELLAEKNP